MTLFKVIIVVVYKAEYFLKSSKICLTFILLSVHFIKIKMYIIKSV